MRKLLIGVVDPATAKVDNYVRPLCEMGADVHVLTWTSPRDVDADVGTYDAFVLCGGDDIAAHLFGEENHPEVVLDPLARDEYEIELCARAVERDVPVLAVCRGAQVLNVALGGAVDQHIPATPGRHEHRGGVLHRVEIEPGSLVAGFLPEGASDALVNSFHHQGIGRIADGLRVTARTADGVPEAVEGPGAFCLGVQWHPERPEGDPELRLPLFRALLDHAGAAVERTQATNSSEV